MKLVFKLTLSVVVLVGLIGMWLLNAKVDEAQIYQVKKGIGFSQVSKDLHSLPLLMLSKIMQTRLKAGYYQINQHMSVLDLLNSFDRAKVKTIDIRLIEGKTLPYYFAELSQNTVLSSRQTLAEIMQNIGVKKPYEGHFFADTYQVNYGDSVKSVLLRSHQSMIWQVEKIWKNRDENLPLNTSYELITLASLIEKESANMPEKPMIASVFVNRLNKGMRLQTDPTVIYALGKHYKGKLSKNDLKFNSPFNTYRHKGLPPSAIASPSVSSLIAASKPATSDYLYFVAKKDGSHAFAKTYQQHRDNIKKYLKNR